MPNPIIPDLRPVVLAGGSGTRLWPISRVALPKHLAPLVGGRSLLAHTLLRLLDYAPAQQIMTIGAVSQAEALQSELEALDRALAAGLVLEPLPRNTAAAVGLAAALVMSREGGDRILFVCPSDHLVRQPAELRRAVEAALPAVREGALATFGIYAQRPEPGFGYIRVGEPLGSHAGVYVADDFVEKPPRVRAEIMLAEGGWRWNSGMFLFRADRLLEELYRFHPAIAQAVEAARRAMDAAGTLLPPAEIYAQIPEQPIDKAVMERSERVVVVPCDPGWSDLGSWQALWELEERDTNGNAFTGDVEAEDVRGCLARASTRLVALAGVEDLVVVDTPDALLVGRRDGSEALRRLVNRLAQSGRPETLAAPGRAGAWGHETRLASGTGYAVRELLLEPGGEPVEPDAGDAATLWTVVAGEVEQLGATEAAHYGRGDVLRTRAGVRLRNRGAQAAKLVGIWLEAAPTGNRPGV